MAFHQLFDSSMAPGADLMEPQAIKALKKKLHMAEFVAQNTGHAFCFLSLKPARLIYTSETYGQFTGIDLEAGTTQPLRQWMPELHQCPGQLPGPALMGMMEKLVELASAPGQGQGNGPFISMDCCRSVAAQPHFRTEDQIRVVTLGQKSPDVLFLGSVRSLAHLAGSFAYQIRLHHQGKLLDRSVFSPPVVYHPMLQDLSPMERKVLDSIYDSSRHQSSLLMSADTLKTHRRRILQKTGYANMEALLAVLKWESGEGREG